MRRGGGSHLHTSVNLITSGPFGKLVGEMEGVPDAVEVMEALQNASTKKSFETERVQKQNRCLTAAEMLYDETKQKHPRPLPLPLTRAAPRRHWEQRNMCTHSARGQCKGCTRMGWVASRASEAHKWHGEPAPTHLADTLDDMEADAVAVGVGLMFIVMLASKNESLIVC